MATTRIEPAVGFGSSQRSWVTELINYVSDHGGVRVVGTVLTQDDAVTMKFDVLVIDDVSSVLSPRLVDRLQSKGRLVVGIFDADRGTSAKDRLLAAGVDAAVASDAEAAEIVRTVVDAVRQSGYDEEFVTMVESIDRADTGRTHRVDPPADESGGGDGRVLVVLGSDGATEVAAALARATAARGASTVLVDMDTLEPSIAQRLGLPLTPNIFTATEDLRLTSSLDEAFTRHPEGVAVVAGIPNPREWENLSAIEAADLVDELAGGFAVVVVKVSRHLEDLSSFSGGAGRFDVGRRMVARADDVVIVAGASPLGAARLLAASSDVRSISAAPIHVVVGDMPANQFVQGEITEELARTLTSASVTFVPGDSRVRKAAWQGGFVHRGGFVRRIGALADHFVVRPGRGGWRRIQDLRRSGQPT
jgi:Flp pilus assembly CpaE family ATPase